MMGRLALVAAILLLLLVPAFVVGQSLAQDKPGGELPDTLPGSELRLATTGTQAETGIAVLTGDVEIDFPRQAVFTLEAESSAHIVDVRLCYQVDKMKYAEVVSEGRADFAPATRIDASWVWDMRQASLPPGAEVTYWWTIEDTDGNRLETSPETMHFDDGRYVWQSLTSSGFSA